MLDFKISDLFKKSSDALRGQGDIEYIRDRVLAKFPLLGPTMANLPTVGTEVIHGKSVKTAGTDGQTVYYSPKYFETLTDDEKVFVYAHEVMHVAFNHILRSKDRDGKIWNQATDAVINQMLKRENLPMARDGVDIAEAINHSAEEMYEKLMKQKEEKQKQKQQSPEKDSGGKDKPSESNGDDTGDVDDNDEQAGHDNHEIWKETVKQNERDEQKKQSRSDKKDKSSNAPSDPKKNKSESAPVDQADPQQSAPDNGDDRAFHDWVPENEGEFEKGFDLENRHERSVRAAAAQKQMALEKNRAMADARIDSVRSFGDVGKSNAVLDWKKVLKKTLATEEERWSYRRSDADNDYMARVEELEDEDRGETEVLLDTSGSVSDAFLREFLRQLKPLLKNSTLRVGCFDHRFHPFVDIKTDKDIDVFRIPDKGNTDWDLAVKSFSQKKRINKIVFTDGEAPGRMPDASTQAINVIWLVYGTEAFNPVCGRVIRVAPKQISQGFMRPRSPAIQPDKSR